MVDATDILEFGRDLRKRLSLPLPGSEAQLRLSPEPRDGWIPGHIPGDAKTGAGLLLFYPREGGVHTVLTLRNAGLQHHSGQLSLPGGTVEPGESVSDAALREAGEEIGLAQGAVEILGNLTPLYIPVSGFALHPVVGLTADPPEFRPNPSEVERLIEVRVDHLRDPVQRHEEWRGHGSGRYRVPFVRIDGEKLWGATAMVVSELLAILET